MNLYPRDDFFEVTGIHDVDKDWMDSVRGNAREASAPEPLIVPRILLDGWGGEHFMKSFGSEKNRRKVSAMLVKTCRQVHLWSRRSCLHGMIPDHETYV